MINDLIKRLRKAADALENLLDAYPEANKFAAKEISKRVMVEKTQNPVNTAWMHPDQVKSYEKDAKLNRKGTAKGFSYQGKHWTQDPKNKAKLKRVVKKMAEANKKA